MAEIPPLKAPPQPCSVFLPPEKWSKRYGGEFFTLTIPEFRVTDGRYAEYKIVVSCSDFTWEVWRRYRLFADFRNRVSQVPNLSEGHLPDLPPKVWCQCCQDNLNPEFLARRKDGLQEFLFELLKFPGISLDKSVRDFLELHSFETLSEQQNSI